MMAAMRLRRPTICASLAVIALVAVAAGCGSSHANESTATTAMVTGATAAAGSNRIAPPGAPYSYRIPVGWHSLAQFTVGDLSVKARYRSAIARRSGLIYVFSIPRGTANAHTLGVQYANQLKQLGLKVEAVSAGLIGNNPAFIYDVDNVSMPDGGTARARKVLIFSSDAIVSMNCQWSDNADQRATLAGCDSVRATMRVS